MNIPHLFRCLILSAAMLSTALATTVSMTATIDANTFQPGPTVWQVSADLPAVEIKEGDTLDLKINFLSGQTVTLLNPLSFFAFAFIQGGQMPASVTGTGQLSLLDATGLPIYTSNVKTDTEGAVHFGQFFQASEFAGLPAAAVTIGGAHYVGTLNDYDVVGLDSRIYQGTVFHLQGSGLTINNPVPEPQSYALLLAGLGLIGFRARRTRV